ncbi:PadR family transcriptional regulator [Corynebacterium gerontici]|uniref:Transcriptional regulator PadR-like family protein n=1 Tax=Corynebacterium gerontici TaxID=2079234 RepID=A0A3G6IYZ6_9CORY|nr:PadR family transcriptional regulator [Corynebacterium gerontici]AZA11009.1 Transcriptional regulator PadR-like family protein [Corynebacterium gerontici]
MAIKYALLALLSVQDQSASQLRHGFQEATGEIWPLNIGQVAQTLTRLERDGLIYEASTTHSNNGREVQLYSITEEGRSTLEQWWHTPTLHTGLERDELVTKIALAAGRGDVDLLRLLDSQRAGVVEKLRALHRENRTLPDTRTAKKLLYERRIFDLEAEARWLDRVEALAPHNAEGAWP